MNQVLRTSEVRRTSYQRNRHAPPTKLVQSLLDAVQWPADIDEKEDADSADATPVRGQRSEVRGPNSHPQISDLGSLISDF